MKKLLLSLKQLRIIAITTIAISAIGANTCQSQSFTNVPNDSVVATGTMDVETIYDIIQKDNSSDTIFLHWQKVSAVVPDQWVVLICDNNLCYSGLMQGGSMDTMWQGMDGLLSVHITPHANAGTAIVRYAVWDINNPALRDTLTWMITAWQTGINSLGQYPTTIFTSGSQLVVLKNDPVLTHIRVYNLQGRIVLESPLTSNEVLFDVSNFSTGIYFVRALGANTIFTRKILIQ